MPSSLDGHRSLRVVPPVASAVLPALRDALSGSGPAVLPGSPRDEVPETVATRIALVVETSGSTSRPKRVALSADAVLASAAASAASIGGHGQWLLALPVHYIAGVNVLVRSIVSGIDPVVQPEGPFEPLAFAAVAERMDADLRFTSLVPAQLVRLLETASVIPVLQRFDRILIGGQSTPAPVLERARDLGLRLTRTYGSSETAGGCVYDGRPIGNTEVRVVDGEVELAGAVLAEGYLGDEERSAASFVDDAGKRWYRTGDTGDVVDGVLRVTGRRDDVIISGGIKVSLADVERVVRELDPDAVVVAAPSDRWGEVPVVVSVRLLDRDAVRARVSSALGPAAAPDRVVRVAELPVLGSGKPDRLTIARLAQ